MLWVWIYASMDLLWMLGKTEFAYFQKVRQPQLWPCEYETEQGLCFLTFCFTQLLLCAFSCLYVLMAFKHLKSGINVEWKESSKIRLVSSIFFFPSIKWLTIEISQSGSLRSTPSSSKGRYQFCSLWNLGPEILGNCLLSQDLFDRVDTDSSFF